jgi:hypothetical protein
LILFQAPITTTVECLDEKKEYICEENVKKVKPQVFSLLHSDTSDPSDNATDIEDFIILEFQGPTGF